MNAIKDERFGERVKFNIKGHAAEGVITFACMSGSTQGYGPGKAFYHVRDDDGNYWHRTDDELVTAQDG